mgnify:CR=1 FL=1
MHHRHSYSVNQRNKTSIGTAISLYLKNGFEHGVIKIH